MTRRAAVGVGFLTCVVLLGLSGPVGATSGGEGPGGPVVVGGVRVVEIRNNTGGLSAHTEIPTTSWFATYSGTRQPCTFTAATAGTTSDGQPYAAGDTVTSRHWIFREGDWTMWRLLAPIPSEPSPRGPLANAYRWFNVFCDKADIYHHVEFRRVRAIDILLDPHVKLIPLWNSLQLTRPVPFHNPVIDTWGGLVVRYPAWLGIQPDAWQLTWTAPLTYLGWELDLVAEPEQLDFQLDFTPNPDKPSPAFHGIVACITTGTTPTSDGTVTPALPPLPEQTEPGINGPCQWTPPGPGTVTIRARVTYRITFRASGYTEIRPDYVWISEPVTIPTGELTAVNLDPTT